MALGLAAQGLVNFVKVLEVFAELVRNFGMLLEEPLAVDSLASVDPQHVLCQNVIDRFGNGFLIGWVHVELARAALARMLWPTAGSGA